MRSPDCISMPMLSCAAHNHKIFAFIDESQPVSARRVDLHSFERLHMYRPLKAYSTDAKMTGQSGGKIHTVEPHICGCVPLTYHHLEASLFD